tara:strand:- start:140 stop:340 length:201 start_codon:yes stop_codon:yes gene_type:complete
LDLVPSPENILEDTKNNNKKNIKHDEMSVQRNIQRDTATQEKVYKPKHDTINNVPGKPQKYVSSLP